MLRRNLGRTLVLTLLASVLFAAPAAADDEEPSITFFGGGWGHGIGMSQYGAYGRAMAGHTYDEILAFYYPTTSLETVDDFAAFAAGDDVDVRLFERTGSIAVSTPLEQVGSWEVEVFAGDTLLGSSTRPVTATWDGSRWTATWKESGSDETTDLCAAVEGDPCAGAALTIELDAAEETVLEEEEDGDNIGRLASGAVVLHPGNVGTGSGGTPARCGGATSFCVIHGNLDFDEYLRGIDEVPTSWPIDALKAQAIAARSYAASRIIGRTPANGWHEPFDLYDDTQDQVYLFSGFAEPCTGSWCAAVEATEGVVVGHGGTVAETFYSSSNGGWTAEPPDVWQSGSSRPYLVAAEDPFDNNSANPNRAREYQYPLSDVSDWLNDYNETYPEAGDQLDIGTVRSIEIDAPPSGRVTFATVTIVGTERTSVLDRTPGDGQLDPYGFRLYSALKQGCQATPGCKPLRSTNFSIVSVISFVDVEYDDFFYLPVQWMTVESLTTGVGPDRFGATQSNTRGQLATFLWRFAGEPAPVAENPFTDVDEARFFHDAVRWMIDRGVTTGTSPSTFSPDDTVSRAQAATMLWRFAGSPTPKADNVFTDVAAGRFYTDAVRWMVEWGITTGTSPSTFAPDEPVTRAQIATFLWRLAGSPGAFADGIELPEAMR